MGISIGMVGLGQFGQHFVQPFRDHPAVSRLALCDRDEAKIRATARRFRIDETYRDLDQICRSDLDALVIITQPWLHAPQAIQALRSGKHVYTAVPVMYGPDPEELLEWCDRLIDTVTSTGLIYMMGETTYFRPETIFCRHQAEEGAFGAFVYGEGEYFHDLSHGLYGVARKRWAQEWSPEKRGGVPMHYPTHSTAGVISVMNAHMTEVSAQGYVHPGDDWFRQDTLYKNPFSNQVALYRMSNGAAARICEFRRIGHPGREGFRIFGTEGSFEHDVSGSKWVTRDGWEPLELKNDGSSLPDTLAADLGGHGGSHAYLVHEFVDAVVHERQPCVNAWEAVRYFAPGVVAHMSARRDGELLKIPDWGQPGGGSGA